MKKEWIESNTLKDVLYGEYINNVIYNHPERNHELKELLHALSIPINPSVVMTVRIDNFWGKYEDKDNAARYRIKRMMLNRTREAIRQLSLRAAAATLIGTDKIVVLLDTNDLQDESAELLAETFAKTLCKKVTQNADFTISVGISEFCKMSSHLHDAYEQSFRALESTFIRGYGSVLRYAHIEKNGLAFSRKEYRGFVKQFAEDITKQNAKDCQKHIELLFGKIAIMDADESYIKSLIVLFLSDLSQVCAALGLDQNHLTNGILEIIHSIYQAGTLQDIQVETLRFFNTLLSSREQDTALQFNLLDAAAAYIRQYCHEPLTRTEMAAFCGYSDAHFSRCFRQQFGMTFVRYLKQSRLDKAKALLQHNSALSVSQVAEEAGFHNFSHFCSIFKEETGLTPNAFRSFRKI